MKRHAKHFVKLKRHSAALLNHQTPLRERVCPQGQNRDHHWQAPLMAKLVPSLSAASTFAAAASQARSFCQAILIGLGTAVVNGPVSEQAWMSASVRGVVELRATVKAAATVVQRQALWQGFVGVAAAAAILAGSGSRAVSDRGHSVFCQPGTECLSYKTVKVLPAAHTTLCCMALCTMYMHALTCSACHMACCRGAQQRSIANCCL